VALGAATIGAGLLWQARHRVSSPPSHSTPIAVAVLPLQNLGLDKDTDFLRLALADEIATTLSYVRSLSIRPFATTSKYSGPNLDLQQAGHEMRVTNIITGHYLKEGDLLEVTLEAVDVENNRTLWRDNMKFAALDMIAMRGAINAKVRQGLVPALGASTDFADAGTHPQNEQAYDLYLRSVSVPHDPGPNKDGISMLERAVGIDPSYAPAWTVLGLRYYYEATYSTGGEQAFQRSNTAYERALALDPNLITAAGQLITNRADRGESGRAYTDARNLVRRRPENAQAHFALAYVSRYVGLLDQSAEECETALSLDTGNYLFRSCGFTFSVLGKPERALDFARLDAGSEWTAFNMPDILLRQGKPQEALKSAKELPADSLDLKFYEACLGRSPSAELDRVAQEMDSKAQANPDPENKYTYGSLIAFCGGKKTALGLLKTAIEHNYCAYSALQSDPLLMKLRGAPEFSQLLSSAKDGRTVSWRNSTRFGLLDADPDIPTLTLRRSDAKLQ
jgi:TolB-like protein/Tfp pilus assembly protein PilF